MRGKLTVSGSHNSRRFLSSMLKCMEAEGGMRRSILRAVYSENRTLFVQMIVIVRVGGRHAHYCLLSNSRSISRRDGVA